MTTEELMGELRSNPQENWPALIVKAFNRGNHTVDFKKAGEYVRANVADWPVFRELLIGQFTGHNMSLKGAANTGFSGFKTAWTFRGGF